MNERKKTRNVEKMIKIKAMRWVGKMLICWGCDAVLSHGGTHTGPRLQKASPQTALCCFSAPTEMLWNETSWYNHVTSVAIHEQCWKPDLFPVLCCSSTLLHCYGSSLPILFFTVCNLTTTPDDATNQTPLLFLSLHQEPSLRIAAMHQIFDVFFSTLSFWQHGISPGC